MQRAALVVFLLALSFGTLVAGPIATAGAVPPGFTNSQFTSGLSSPTAFALAPDGRLFVTEKGGAIRVVLPDGTLVGTPFVSLPVAGGSEQGALGIAFHPEFPSEPWVYVYWTANVGGGQANRISRFRGPGNESVEQQDLVTLDPQLRGNHNGGAIHFGPDNNLYAATGDGAADPSRAQSISTRQGKILRYDALGGIPADNPFGPGNPVYALGLRNPYTFAFGPSGVAHVNDVGSGGSAVREEINVLERGANYGWPQCEGVAPGCNPTGPGPYRDPIYAYAHGPGDAAITGGAFYTGTAFPPEYHGDYFFADYGGGWIDRRDDQTGQVTRFEPAAGSVVDLLSHPDGSLLYLDIAGRIGRISFPGAPPPPPPPAGFERITPTRVVDTRAGVGGTRLFAGQTLEIPLGAIVPTGATAVAANLTSDGAAADGFLTAYPCGQTPPPTSTLNYLAGAPAAAGALVGLGGGSLCVRTYADTDLVVDVSGWFGPAAGAGYAPVLNTRLLDTRSGAALAAGASATVSAATLGSGTAVAVNLTLTEAAADGYLTAWPCGEERPIVSNLNARRGETRANQAVVPLAADGTLCVYSYGGGHVVVDAVGRFGSGAGSAFQPLTPSRLLDTRTGSPVAAGTAAEVTAPAGASAVALSVVATEGAAAGYLTAYPCGEPPPVASTVNHLAGQTIANGAIARVGTTGKVCVFSYATTDVIVDLTGVFT